MKANNNRQKLPASGPAREALRQKGQFWTLDWVAEAMVAYCIAGGSDSIFDLHIWAAIRRVSFETWLVSSRSPLFFVFTPGMMIRYLSTSFGECCNTPQQSLTWRPSESLTGQVL
jgi:hypothetical protein